MRASSKNKKSEELVDAIAPEVRLEDVEDDAKSLFDRQLDKREPDLFFEADSNVRMNLRRYCIFLIIFSCFPLYYSIIFCGPLELGMTNVRLVNPMFNKYDSSRQCSSVTKSIQNGILAFFIFYGLKIYNKLYLSLLYLCLLFYFGWEVRSVKMEWSKHRIAVTSHERLFHFVDLGLLIFQTIVLFPILVGGYYLIRHVRRKSTFSEISKRNENFEEEARLLKTRMKVERARLNLMRNKEKEKMKMEEEKLKFEEQQEKIYKLKRSAFEMREKVRKEGFLMKKAIRDRKRKKFEKEKAMKELEEVENA
ncbi:unnamed protein product [Caenorhabditis nigoni]